MKKIFMLFLIFFIAFSTTSYANFETLDLKGTHIKYSSLDYFEKLSDNFNEEHENILTEEMKVEQSFLLSMGTNYSFTDDFSIIGSLSTMEKITGKGEYNDQKTSGDLEDDGEEITTITEGSKDFELNLTSISGLATYNINKYIDVKAGPIFVLGSYKENYKHLVTEERKVVDEDTGIVQEEENIVDQDGYSEDEDIFDLGFEAGMKASKNVSYTTDLYANLSYRYFETEILDDVEQDLSGFEMGLGISLIY